MLVRVDIFFIGYRIIFGGKILQFELIGVCVSYMYRIGYGCVKFFSRKQKIYFFKYFIKICKLIKKENWF